MKLLVVDDDSLIRDGLKMILEAEVGFSVVGTASNGQEALRMCMELQPEIVQYFCSTGQAGPA